MVCRYQPCLSARFMLNYFALEHHQILIRFENRRIVLARFPVLVELHNYHADGLTLILCR